MADNKSRKYWWGFVHFLSRAGVHSPPSAARPARRSPAASAPPVYPIGDNIRSSICLTPPRFVTVGSITRTRRRAHVVAFDISRVDTICT